MSGHQAFADELTRFAAGAGVPGVTAIAERVAAPLRVAVGGRRGVGRRTVARALEGAGIEVTPRPGAAGVTVYVTAEVVKPEDAEAVAAARQPVLVVLNKADLTGPLSDAAGDGPIATARPGCARFSALLGVPVEPMIGLLAVASLDGVLDDTAWAALRVLGDYPGLLNDSVDGFLAAPGPVPTHVRRRLLDSLDLFGVALGVAAVRQGGSVSQVRAVWRRVSCVDAVVGKVTALGAVARYRRVLGAVAELEALAVTDERVGEFLCRDETVIARMAVAADVVEATDGCDDPAAHLARALRWQRYSRGPVSALHRACGADIARGSLRLWSRAGGSP